MGDEGVSRKGLASAAVCLLLALAALVGPTGGRLSGPAEARRPASPVARNPVPVVMVLFDEFPLASLLDRDLEIDAGLYPNFAALAEGSTWYRNATTVAEFTRGALPALLTGLEPEQALLSFTGQRPQSIFTLLEETHALRTSRAFPNLCDLSSCPRTPRVQGRPERVLRVVSRETRGESMLAFMEGLEATDEPCLCLLHMILPHSPWRYLPSGQQYPGTSPMPGQVEIPGPGRKWRDHPWLVKQARQRHLLQVGFVDRVVGSLIDEMERLGVYDEALVVVAADHGVAFSPGLPKRGTTRTTAGDIAWVPLFVKMPHQDTGAIVDEPVQTIDIVPTITAALEIDGALPMQGVPLSQTGGRPEPRLLGTVVLPNDTSALSRAVERRFAVFPDAVHWLDLFRLAPGEHGIWLDLPVGEVAAAPGVAATLEDAEGIEEASASDGRIPALVKGALTGSRPGRSDRIAIAVNGRIVAVTETYTVGDVERFYALVPPTAYSAPPNELRLFLIGDDATLTEITPTAF